MLRKRLYQHSDDYSSLGFLPKFTHPKAYANRNFPKHCGVVAQKVDPEVVAIKFDPSTTLVLTPASLTCGSSSQLIESDQQAIKLDTINQNESEIQKKIDSEIMETEGVHPEAKSPPISNKFPKMRHGVFARRQFPPNCGVRNHASKFEGSSEMVPIVEPEPVKETLTICDVSVRDENADLCGIVPEIEDRIVKLKDAGNSNSKLINEVDILEDALARDDDLSPHNEKAEDHLEVSITPYEACIAVNNCGKVKEVLKLFGELYAKQLQKHKASAKGLNRHYKCQIPVEAAQILKRQQGWVNKEKKFGHVLGVKIGDSFRYRAELAVVGLHHQYVYGIDYVKINKKEYGTSIVVSGRHYDNERKSDEILIYSGQGGGTHSDKRVDQKLEGPNQALINSMDEGHPVRVIRGCLSKGNRVYIYEGLFRVINCIQERGQQGKLVYKFELHRLKGQPKVIYESSLKPHRNNCVVSDISYGTEKVPIRVVNEIDNDKPPPFTYMATMVYPHWYQPSVTTGCNCINGCSNLENCSSVGKNNGNIVYECGPSCNCTISCKNRASQIGSSYSFEVFKTQSRGWGIRSRDYIPSGSFICEYIGELLKDNEAEQRVNHDDYLFDIANNSQDEREGTFAIDAHKFGNVGRFINHSCSPNLYAQDVLYQHDDKRLPHIMFFAAKNIRPLTELTYDYNYKIDHVLDANGNIKKKECYCGARECSGRMY